MVEPSRLVEPTLFHITHWKAGSQWIQEILRGLAPDRIVAPRLGEGQVLFDRIVPGGIYPTVYLTKEQVESIELPAGSRRFIVLRDLRDTLVSGYFSAKFSHAIAWSGTTNLRARLDALNQEEGMLYLAEKWLQGVAVIQASWLASGEPIVRYEDLLGNDVDLLEETLVKDGGIRVDRATLKTVVEANRFDAMSGGRERGSEDVNAHARKAIAGDWQNHFTPAIRKRVDELYGHLVRSYARSGPRAAKAGSSGMVRVSTEEVLRGYDVVSAIHPILPTYAHWLAWEWAAFRRIKMQGQVLDLGCSDPRFFDAILPEGCTATGVSADPSIAEWASHTGRYSDVTVSADYSTLGAEASADHVFSRGTLVHINALDATLAAIRRTLRPDGTLICSVLTHRYAEWGLLPRLFEICGYPDLGKELRQKHFDFHAIRNAMPMPEWCQRFTAAGFEVVTCTPVVPRFNAQANLLFDVLWHVPNQTGGELGDQMAAYLSARPGFRTALRGALNALMELENDWEDTVGAVFELRKARWRGLSIFRR